MIPVPGAITSFNTSSSQPSFLVVLAEEHCCPCLGCIHVSQGCNGEQVCRAQSTGCWRDMAFHLPQLAALSPQLGTHCRVSARLWLGQVVFVPSRWFYLVMKCFLGCWGCSAARGEASGTGWQRVRALKHTPFQQGHAWTKQEGAGTPEKGSCSCYLSLHSGFSGMA